jgi:hypothetical protein
MVSAVGFVASVGIVHMILHSAVDLYVAMLFSAAVARRKAAAASGLLAYEEDQSSHWSYGLVFLTEHTILGPVVVTQGNTTGRAGLAHWSNVSRNLNSDQESNTTVPENINTPVAGWTSATTTVSGQPNWNPDRDTESFL